jgi:hypothetical protein
MRLFETSSDFKELKQHTRKFLQANMLSFSYRSKHISTVKGYVKVAKLHNFVHSGI